MKKVVELSSEPAAGSLSQLYKQMIPVPSSTCLSNACLPKPPLIEESFRNERASRRLVLFAVALVVGRLTPTAGCRVAGRACHNGKAGTKARPSSSSSSLQRIDSIEYTTRPLALSVEQGLVVEHDVLRHVRRAEKTRLKVLFTNLL